MLNTILIIAVLYAIHTAVAALPTWLFVIAWVIFAARAVQGLFSSAMRITEYNAARKTPLIKRGPTNER